MRRAGPLLSGVAITALLARSALAQVAPAGSVIDLASGTTPSVGTYTQYSTTVTAQATGQSYVLFAFREDPAYFHFDDAAVMAVGSTTNLLTNAGFENGTTPSPIQSNLQLPVGWGIAYQTGNPPPAAGTVNGNTPHSGSSVWYDGSVGSFDGLYQTVSTVAGQQYLISFFLNADDPYTTSYVEMATYFGACDSSNGNCSAVFGNGFSVGTPAGPVPPANPTIDTTSGDIQPNVFSLGSPAARAATVEFDGGTLRMTGGSFANNIVTAPVLITLANGTVDTGPASGGFSGVVSGPGALTIVGANTFTLSGANTYSGGTIVQGGTVAIGDSSALGTGPVSLANGTTLQFVAPGLTLANLVDLVGPGDPTIDTMGMNATISGPVVGAGDLTKIGAGTLALTGISPLTGPTQVLGGTLEVDGSIASSAVTVGAGATVSGRGTIGSLTLQSGATLAPGLNALTVAGNVALAAGSTYQVAIAADGTASKLAVNGQASLGGAALAVHVGAGNYSPLRYTLLTAASGVNGTFGSVTLDTNFALLTPVVGYDPTDVTLSLQPVPFASVAQTRNQAAAGAAIQALGPTSALYNAVILQDLAGVRQALATAAGTSHADPANITASSNRLVTTLVLDRLWDVSGNGMSARDVLDQFTPDGLPALVRCYGPVPDPVPAAPKRSYTAWGEGFGSFGHSDASANAGSLDRSLGGFVLGIDTPIDKVFGNSWRTGVALGYTNSTFTTSLGSGSGTVQGVFGSLYSGARYGAIDVRLGATVGGTFTDARRSVAFPGFLEGESSFNRGVTAQGFGEVGYRFASTSMVLEPVAGASILHIHQDGFAERGGAAALQVAALDNDLGTTALGFRGEATPFAGIPLTAHGYLAWQHVIGNVSPATVMAFEANPAQTFTVTGTPLDRDALAAEAALDYRTSAALDVGLSYSGVIGPTASDHSVKGRFEYRF